MPPVPNVGSSAPAAVRRATVGWFDLAKKTYKPIEIKTHLDFSREGGFMAAVEMCNGAAVCRKLKAGTMCPSFMATRDEQDTTRARANALRNALAGRASSPGCRRAD